MRRSNSDRRTTIVSATPRLSQDGQARRWLARAGVLLMGIVVLRLAFELWWVGRIHENGWVQAGVSLMYALGAVFLVLSAIDIRHERFDTLGFLVLCGCLGFYTAVYMQVVAKHYTSDALLFVHQSSLLALQGLNPYQHSLLGAYEAFQVPYYVQTPTTSGGLITNLNYPALAFLTYTPFVALGLEDLRPVSAAFLLATLGVVYVAAPRHLRLLSLSFLFLSSFFLSFALSGFDIVYVFFLLVTVVTWRTDHAMAMVAYGMSAAIKQQVWFIAPFLLIKLWHDAPIGDPFNTKNNRRKRLVYMAKHAGLSVAAFVVPNAWYFIWDPGSWLRGVFTPLGGSGDTLVPLSQGATIAFYTGSLTASPLLLSLLAFAAMLGLLLLYGKFYQHLQDMLWVTPVLILVVNPRALQNYYDMFYPILLAMLLARIPLSWEDPDPPPKPLEADTA